MDQDERERALINLETEVWVIYYWFRPGLDIPEMNHVIHYHLPKEDEFTHRNGRTARMLSTGTYIIAHESEKNGIYQLRMDVFK
jgi:superfamily II DNA/RNA helicase